jgi:hypothetical protein
MQKYNFACGSVWMWNLVSDMKGGIQTEGVWKHEILLFAKYDYNGQVKED